MNDTEALRRRWDALHGQPRYLPVFPNESVVRWQRRSFPDAEANRPSVVDIGCGGGRHSLAMARDGIQVTACDLSPVGVAAVASRARQEKLRINTYAAAMQQLPFAANQFDGLLCFGVLNYVPVSVIEEAISEFARILKPGGRFHIMARGDKDWRIRFARMTAAHEYELAGLEDTPAAAEEGLRLTLFDRPLIDRLFDRFEKLEVDWFISGQGGGLFNNSDWHISGQNP